MSNDAPLDSPLSHLGRRVYGLAAVALGLVELAFGDFSPVWHPVPPGVPLRRALLYAVSAALVAGGVAVMGRRAVRAGATVLGVLSLGFALLWVRRVVAFPGLWGTWGGFLEQLAPAFAAVLLTRPGPRTARAARLAFGVCVASFGVGHFAALPQTAAMVPSWLPPGQRFWAMVTGACHLLAGGAIASGVLAPLAARLLAAMLLGFGALVWTPSVLAQPHSHTAWAGDAVTLLLAGAAWVVGDRLGSPRARPAVTTGAAARS